jgi:hypothetical protein
MPDKARTTVETVAPQVATTKRNKKGMLLIGLGLLAGAAAVALIVNGRKKKTDDGADGPEVERLVPAEPPGNGADDAVGEAEKKVEAAIQDDRQGRHAARK